MAPLNKADNNVKYDIVVKIRLDYNKHIIKWLNEKGHDYELEVIKDLTPYQTKEEINSDLPFVQVENEIFEKLEKLSNATNIPLKDIVSKELGAFLFSVGDNCVLFLDRHLGIKNIKNPIEILEKMDPIINIGEMHLNHLKTQDLSELVDNWHHPLKNK